MRKVLNQSMFNHEKIIYIILHCVSFQKFVLMYDIFDIFTCAFYFMTFLHVLFIFIHARVVV